MPKVFVTRALPDSVLAELAAHAQVEVGPHDRGLTPEELRAAVAGCDAVVSLLTDVIDEAALAAAGPRLKVVANVAVGFNNLDLAAATRRGVILTNTPGVLDDATATLAMALLLATARRLAEADAFVRAGRWSGWTPSLFMGLDVDGRTLGIAGAGRIGRNLARKARAFGMEILYAGRRRDQAFEAETGAVYVDKPTLLARADFLSLHLPLAPETRHWIGAGELRRMKPTAVLINTARGPVVDETALVAALRDGAIAAAGLDVFENEPRLSPGLADLPNVVLAPHIGSATPATREAMARLAVRNVVAVLSGQGPLTCVNPEVLGRGAGA